MPTRSKALHAPAQEIYTDLTWMVRRCDTGGRGQSGVRSREVDAIFRAAGIPRRGIYVFSVDGASAAATAYARRVGATGIEDPATGSAAGPAGAYMVKHGYVGAERAGPLVIAQGVMVQRPSKLHVPTSALRLERRRSQGHDEAVVSRPIGRVVSEISQEG